MTNVGIIFIATQLNIDVVSTLMIIYSNLLIILFNLIPIYPLDGGRVLKGVLHIFYGKLKAERYINKISFVTLIVLTFISSIAIYEMENVAIFIIVLALWGIVIREDIIYRKRNKIYNLMEKII